MIHCHAIEMKKQLIDLKTKLLVAYSIPFQDF